MTIWSTKIQKKQSVTDAEEKFNKPIPQFNVTEAMQYEKEIKTKKWWENLVSKNQIEKTLGEELGIS